MLHKQWSKKYVLDDLKRGKEKGGSLLVLNINPYEGWNHGYVYSNPGKGQNQKGETG